MPVAQADKELPLCSGATASGRPATLYDALRPATAAISHNAQKRCSEPVVPGTRPVGDRRFSAKRRCCMGAGASNDAGSRVLFPCKPVAFRDAILRPDKLRRRALSRALPPLPLA